LKEERSFKLRAIKYNSTTAMSRAAKLTLAGTSLFAISTVFFVHYAQQAEKSVRPLFFSPLTCPSPLSLLHYPNTNQAMHAGVIRDVEQQRLKKERQLDFDMQKALEEEYKKIQNVHDGGAEEKVLYKPR
jgi:protein PET117